MSKAIKKNSPPFVRERVLSLAEKHGWRASEGHKRMVVGRGDLRFEYPNGWVHEITEQSVKVRDKVFPHDVMVLEVSVVKAPPVTDWDKLPSIRDMLADNLGKQGREVAPEDFHTVQRPGLDAAWAEYETVEEDPQTHLPRPAVWRQAHACPGRLHRGPHMPFGIVSFGFWKEFADRADAFWEHFLANLVMGQHTPDPPKGPILN